MCSCLGCVPFVGFGGGRGAAKSSAFGTDTIGWEGVVVFFLCPCPAHSQQIAKAFVSTLVGEETGPPMRPCHATIWVLSDYL